MAPNCGLHDKKSSQKTLRKSSKLSHDFDNGNNSDIIDQFEISEKFIHKLESTLEKHKRHCYLFENHIDDAKKYLEAVDSILQLIDDQVLLKDTEFVDRVDGVIQTAMCRLEEEFRGVLIRSVVPLDGEQLCERLSVSIRRVSISFASNASEDFESSVDDDHESLSEDNRRVSLGDEGSLDLMDSDAVSDLREIAERMIKAGYEKECCQVYSSVRCDALCESLLVLGVERMSIVEVQKLEWGLLDDKMKKWIQAVKTVTRFLLFAEKQLCDRVFGGSEQSRGACFTEIAKACVMQLLNFGEAIVIVQRSPEMLFRILDMYDALANSRLDLQALFSYGSSDFICSEVERVLAGLGEAVNGTFVEFEARVQNESSRMVTPGGEIHPMASYVMNYLKLVVDYSESLSHLLENKPESSHHSEGGNNVTLESDNLPPMGGRILSLITHLESNLENKSKLYEDVSLRYIFLMNNIFYIVQKVKNSELGKFLGDNWIRKRRGQVRQYATCYLRASWSKVLSLLKDDGFVSSGSKSNIWEVSLKEKFKHFNAAFEEIYKSQTAWKVPDPQLRDEIRISISERVIPAYRSFMGRVSCQLDRVRHASRYMKYTLEDIENYLLDLFDGVPGDLHNSKRKPRT
ncbi:hypothetical protein ACHQM5_010519 [Ranunculus cassubicifolius]